jgi:uncharacterized protein YerC
MINDEVQRKLIEFILNHPSLTYNEIAERVGVSGQTISRYCLKYGIRRRRGSLTVEDLNSLDNTGEEG